MDAQHPLSLSHFQSGQRSRGCGNPVESAASPSLQKMLSSLQAVLEALLACRRGCSSTRLLNWCHSLAAPALLCIVSKLPAIVAGTSGLSCFSLLLTLSFLAKSSFLPFSHRVFPLSPLFHEPLPSDFPFPFSFPLNFPLSFDLLLPPFLPLSPRTPP